MSDRASNITEYTVSGIAAALKGTIEDAFGNVRVRGEITGYRGPHSSGHAYFALKDDRARLDAVVWRTTMQRLRFPPAEGLEVVATGRLSTHPQKSQVQLIVDWLQPAGTGALMALLEERRRRLAAEGLFDAARKRPLPFLPQVIGVVTSPTGAVIRDILHRLRDRFALRVVIWPVRVQGETAAAEVAAAIAGFNRPDIAFPRPDLLIVARGGGSLEDLWAFNEEIVVRAAFASHIPLISAVGHETDTTLIDFAADRRAPTPTGAAEMAVPVRMELLARLDGVAARLSAGAARGLRLRRQTYAALCRAMPAADDLLAGARRSLDELSSRLGRSLIANTLARRERLTRIAGRLSPANLRSAVEARRNRFAVAADRNRRALALAAERKRGAAAAAAARLRPDLLSARLSLLRDLLDAASGRKVRSLAVHAERKRAGLELAARRLRWQPIAGRASQDRQALTAAAGRLGRAMDLALDRAFDRFEALDKLLAALAFSKESILARGYALLIDAKGRPVTSATAVLPGMALEIELQDGRANAVATGAGRLIQRIRRRRSSIGDAQPGLFDGAE